MRYMKRQKSYYIEPQTTNVRKVYNLEVEHWLCRNEKEEKTKPTCMKFLSSLLTASLGERESRKGKCVLLQTENMAELIKM